MARRSYASHLRVAAAVVVALMAAVLLYGPAGDGAASPDRSSGQSARSVPADESDEPVMTRGPATSATRSNEAGSDSEAVFIEPRAGDGLRVQVLLPDGASPAAGARVWVVERDHRNSSRFDALFAGISVGPEFVRKEGREYLCDSSGLAIVPLPGEDRAVLALHEGGVARRKQVGAPPTSEITLVLEPRAEIRVLVQDGRGVGLPEFPVAAFVVRDGRRREQVRRYTDSAGLAQFDIGLATSRDWAFVAGFPSIPPVIAHVRVDDGFDGPVVLTIPGERNVRFEIVEADGRRCESRTVVMVSSRDSGEEAPMGAVERLAADLAFHERVTLSGAVQFQCLPEEKELCYRVHFTDRDEEVTGVIPGQGAEGDAVVISVTRPTMDTGLSGQWTRGNGPVGIEACQARVHVGTEEWPLSRSFSPSVNTSGRFEVDLGGLPIQDAGEIAVEIWSPTAPANGQLDYFGFEALAVPVGAETELPSMSLDGEEMIVSGRVESESGDAVPFARIEMDVWIGDQGGWRPVFPPVGRVLMFADEQGAFVVRGISNAPRIRVNAGAPGCLSATSEVVPGTKGLVLRLGSESGIPIRVEADSGVIDDLHLRLVRDLGLGVESLTATSVGGFVGSVEGAVVGEFRGVGPGQYEAHVLSLTTGELLASVDRIVVQRSPGADEKDPRILPLDLRGRLHRKKLFIECGEGGPPADARLMIDDEPVPNGPIENEMVFASANAAPRIRIMAEGYLDGTLTLGAASGTIRLERAPVLRIVLTGPLIRESDQQFYVVLGDRVTQFSAKVGSDGIVEVPIPRDAEFNLRVWELGREPRQLLISPHGLHDVEVAVIPPLSEVPSREVQLEVTEPVE